jgi:hypothetical protein
VLLYNEHLINSQSSHVRAAGNGIFIRLEASGVYMSACGIYNTHMEIKFRDEAIISGPLALRH